VSRNDKAMRRLRWAAFFALVGLALIVWSLFDPTPVPIIVSMSLGQVIGTLSFGLYLLVVGPEVWQLLRPPRADQPAQESEPAAPPKREPQEPPQEGS